MSSRVPLGPLLAVCQAAGYDESLRTEQFPVLTPRGLFEVDVSCFGKTKPQDMSTVTILGSRDATDISASALRDAARSIAAPVALQERDDRVSVWSIALSENDDVRVTDDLRPDGIAAQARLLDALAPANLVARKEGRSNQLTLFDQDVSLLAHARRRAEDTLSKRVATAMTDLWPSASEPGEQDAQSIARTVVQALAVLVSRDKLTQDRTFESALAVLQERYSSATVGLSEPANVRAVRQAVDTIGEGVRFDALDATILGDVYENTFLQDATRKRLGAFYTPPSVARQMLQAVPVEEIPPANRRALDLTCGSGTLLLASWDRFAETQPGTRSTSGGRGLLTGFDRDGFAIELAQLALIIHSSPDQLDWDISQRDALTARPDGVHRPHSVVVGNPPWAYSRQAGVPVERSTDFLDAMLRWCEPGGQLAFLMPASWLTSNVSRASRAALREATDIQEIWRLPETTFEAASVAPCAVFAQKKPARVGSHWLYRRVPRGRLDEFLEDSRFAPGTLVPDGESTQPFMKLLSLEAQFRLKDVATLQRGVPMPANKATGRTDDSGNVRLLPGYRDIGPYARVPENRLVSALYPDDFSKRGTDPSFWHQPKVVLATTTNVDGPRARAFVDDHSVVLRNSMTGIVPRPNTDLNRLALMAILNSSVVASWLEGSSMRWIGNERLHEMPVPGPESWPLLADLASQLQREEPGSKRFVELQQEVDEQVSSALGLIADPPESRPSSRVPGVPASQADEPLLAIGAVEDVRDGQLLLHIAGITDDEGVWVDPPAGLPGWACRPGIGFRVVGAEGGLADAVYLPHRAAWRAGTSLSELERAV